MKSSANSQNDVSQEKIWHVSIITAKSGDYAPNIILHGITESPRHTTLKAAITADVMTVSIYEGNIVEKNKLLLQLDKREMILLVKQREAEVSDLNAQIKAEFRRAETDKKALEHETELLKLSEKDLKRQEHLLKQRVGSEAAHDQTKRTVQQQALIVTNRKHALNDHKNRLMQLQSRHLRAIALLDQAKLDLSRTQIRAPFKGRITKLNVSPGNRVQVGEALLDIYDISNIEVRAQIPSQYVATIHGALTRGEQLLASSQLDNQKLSLKLDRLSGKVEIGRGGVDGLFKISTANSHWALGRSVQIYFNLPKQKNIYKIPRQALYGIDRIYIVKDNRMHAMTVKRVGFIHYKDGTSSVLIKSDKLKPNDQVITIQLPNARTGLSIKATEQ